MYKIIPSAASKPILSLHPNTAKRLGLYEHSSLFFRFGIIGLETNLKLTSEIQEDEILLASFLIDKLTIPCFCRYELVRTEWELILGPYIGILATKSKHQLSESVHVLRNYVYDYPSIGGAIIAFSVEGINEASQTIQGFIYNPNSDQWEEGIYHYPRSIFKRSYLPPHLRNHFSSLLGPTLFNSYHFDKWEMYQWLSEQPPVRVHLPYTELYRTPNDIYTFLDLYGAAFIKPIYGSQGMGIMQIQKQNTIFLISYREKGININHVFDNQSELRNFFSIKIRRHQYLLQEVLNAALFDDKKVDFRLIFVKDGSGKWRSCFLVARYGGENSIVTNISDGGKADVGEKALKEVLGYCDSEVFSMLQRMNALCQEIAHIIEQNGIHLGNLGIDLMLDKTGHIWIIEINNRDPNHTIILDAGEVQTFYLVKKLNMLYAKKLAGFEEGEGT